MPNSQSYNLNTLITTYTGQDPQGDIGEENLQASLADIAHNVKQDGADPTKTNDSYQAFINALQNNEVVLVPVGDFIINTAITIASSFKVQKIIGIGKDKSRLFFNGTDGIVNNKSGVIIEGIGIYGASNMGSGIKMLAPIQMKNCNIYSFNIGIDISQSVNIVTSFFEKITVAYNHQYGVLMTSGGSNQNNAITFKELYIVKNGVDADTMTTNATIGSGDGMYISGGYAITIANCVFEYNTGVGLRLDPKSYHLYGVNVITPYFERNKYGQLYVDNGSYSYSMTAISIRGDFYTDAGLTPVANSLANRQLYVPYPDKVLNTPNNNFFGSVGFADRNILTRRPNLLNAFPINRMSDLAVDYPNNIVTYNSESVFQITNTVPGVMFYSELMYIDSIYDYVFSYDITNIGTTAAPNLLAYLYDNDSGSTISTGAICGLGSAFGWKTIYAKVTGLSATKALRLYLNVEGTLPSDLQVYIKNIRLIPIVKNTALPANTTANRPTSNIVAGTQFFDTTLNKPIWWKGSGWVDATGASV